MNDIDREIEILEERGVRLTRQIEMAERLKKGWWLDELLREKTRVNRALAHLRSRGPSGEAA